MIIIDEEDSRTAAHEAGHLLLMWPSEAILEIHGLRRLKTSVKIEAKYVEPWLERHAWEGLIISAAGMAAEKLTFGDFEPGPCQSDLGLMRVSIEDLQQTKGGELPMPPWPEASAGHAPPFERFFKKRLPLGHAIIMTWAYRSALDLLGEGLTPLRRLHELFLEDIERSHDEIAAVLGPRPTFV